MISVTNFFATCPKNLEGLLEEELISLGAKSTKQTVAGVKFTGDLTLAYRVCLWSRLANRILLPLAEFQVASAEDLYEGVRRIIWLEHLKPENSLVIDFTGVSLAIKNSHFGALKVKDAIVDQIREIAGKRPNIDKEQPDIRLNVYLYHEVATISIDLSGESLHRRGYRICPGAAPLKENLAAAVLSRSGWMKFASEGKPLFDPMCGSGTLLIEAAMIAQDYAPGLLRNSFGFDQWLHHDQGVWQQLQDEARDRHNIGRSKCRARIYGSDTDPEVVAAVSLHIQRADLEQMIKVTAHEIQEISPAQFKLTAPGIIVTNPPYGKRLQEEEGLGVLYRDFGRVLRENFLGWEMAMLTGNPELGKTMGIRAYKQYSFFNGTLPCKLLLFHIVPPMFWREYKGEKEV